MILQALENYFDRAHDAGNLPPIGWMSLPIDYILEIDKSGTLLQVVPRFETRGAKKIRKQEMLPAIGKQAIKHTNSGEDPNLLWDNAGFVVGMESIDATEKAKKKAKKRLSCFRSLLTRVFRDSNDEGIQAIFKFYERNGDKNSLIANAKVSKSDTVTLQLNSDNKPILYRHSVRPVIDKYLKTSGETVEGACLVTGENTPISKNHYAIKNIWGASSEGPLVSFNEDAYESYGRKKGAISPVGNRTMIAYTTALNHLLRKGSKQRFQVGDASTIFWAEKTTSMESDFSTIFGSTPKKVKDDPDAYTRAVKAVFDSAYQGRHQENKLANRFYVLGLSPNASRISIRFWQVATVTEISQRIEQHFEYLNMIHGPKEMRYLPLFIFLVNVASQGKSENIPPNLAGELMRSILTGRPYPQTMLSAAIRCCKAEQKVNYPRAAIIKACINSYQSKEELKMALDIENTNPAYRLGRLFAVLEKIQEEASPGINATIKDRYYGAASSNPVSVFSTLLKLKNHHLSKLESVGRKINLEKLIGDIMCRILPDLPASLNLQDQGRFAVGYYHQRQDFFTSKQTKEPGEES